MLRLFCVSHFSMSHVHFALHLVATHVTTSQRKDGSIVSFTSLSREKRKGKDQSMQTLTHLIHRARTLLLYDTRVNHSQGQSVGVSQRERERESEIFSHLLSSYYFCSIFQISSVAYNFSLHLNFHLLHIAHSVHLMNGAVAAVAACAMTTT